MVRTIKLMFTFISYEVDNLNVIQYRYTCDRIPIFMYLILVLWSVW